MFTLCGDEITFIVYNFEIIFYKKHNYESHSTFYDNNLALDKECRFCKSIFTILLLYLLLHIYHYNIL